MRGQRGARGVGRAVACARPRPSSSARRTSAGCSRRSSATSTASTRCRPASTSTSSCRRPRDEALAALLEEARADPPNPGNRQERLPDEGNARAARRVLRRRRADRPLLREAALQQGRPRAASRRCTGSTRGRSSSASATTGTSSSGSHRRGRSSPGRSSTGTSFTCSRSRTSPSCPSIFPEAFGMVAAEAAAAGCPPLVARHSGLEEIAEGLEEAYPADLPAPRELRDGRLARPRRQAPRAARAAGRPPPGARRGRARASRSSSWSWAGVAARLLEPLQ